MDKFRDRLPNRLSVSQILEKRDAFFQHSQVPGDFKGCYVLFDKDAAVYVGISKHVYARLVQHLKRKSHFSASLAYLIAKQQSTEDYKSREAAMASPQFELLFKAAQARMTDWSCAAIAIDDDIALYLFEVYCSLELQTSSLNSFKTH